LENYFIFAILRFDAMPLTEFFLTTANDIKFSVLMPTYDRDDLVLSFDAAINSCLENTVSPDEIVVVVDGPVREEFASKIRYFEDKHQIKVIWLQFNVGITSALNEGLKHVCNQYVFRADGDDINRPNRFEFQLKMLAQGYDLVGSAICERDSVGRLLAIKRSPTDHEAIVRYALRRCPFNHMTVAFNVNAVLAVGGYPHEISPRGLGEDWALWVLLLKSGVRAANTDEILVDASADISMYRRRGGFSNVFSELKMQRFLINHLEKNILVAVFDLIAKGVFFLIPSRIRGFVYTQFLRESK